MRISVKPHSLPDRFLFPLVCAFWASQVFLVPIAPIGPWPVWPALSDFIILLMIPAVLLSPRKGSTQTSWLIRFSIQAALICLASFLLATAIYGPNTGTLFGLQQLYRVAEMIFAALATSKVRLTLKRIQVLAALSIAVFAANCAAVFATGFHLIPTGAVTPLLPDGPAGGLWMPFIQSTLGEGTGFINYNHAYTAIQLILCAGLVISVNKLSRRNRAIIQALLLASTFVTRSRSGFICAVLFVLAYELKRSRAVVLAISAVLIVAGLFVSQLQIFSTYAERQTSSAGSLDEDVAVSSRFDTWKDHLDHFAEHPATIMLGNGFGYSYWAVGQNAHMLYLHIASELGLIGLGAFLWGSWKLLRALKAADTRAMYWCFVLLLLTGLTQETFYPTLVFTHFIAFFLSAVIATIRIKSAQFVTFEAVSSDPAAIRITTPTQIRVSLQRN